MSSEINRLYEFGDFRIDLRKGLLLQRGQPVSIPPKAFETLIALVESDGRVISKEELMAKVWGATFVEENNLTQQISLLRRVLQDSEQAIIETVPRRGYRFAAEVRASPALAVDRLPLAGEPPPPTMANGKRPTAYAAVIAAALIVVAVIAWRTLRPSGRGDMPRTMAVLPFKPLVPGSGDPYLELGMADALITELSNVREINVRPTSSVVMYTSAGDAAAIGQKLGVEAVLDGRIQRAGNRIRVTAQLVRVSNGAPLWAGKFDEDMNNMLAVQDAISARIVSALMLDLSGEEKRSLGKRATQDAEAYQLYLRGRYHWYRWTPDEWVRSRDYFEQAVAKDPNFALAWCGLADSLGVQLWFRPPSEVAPAARAAAMKALELDPAIADPYTSLAPMALFYDWDRVAAARYLRKAIELNPNHALSHDLYALFFASGGRFREALAQSRRALELDPTSPYMNTDLGTMYYYQRKYDEAEKHVRAALALDPDYADAFRYLASIEEQRGHEATAIDAWANLLVQTGDPDIAASLRDAFAKTGYRSALETWLALTLKKSEKSYVTPLDIADLHARLGNREQALTWLGKAKEDRSPGLIWIAVEPRWDAYREDARFQAVVASLHIHAVRDHQP